VVTAIHREEAAPFLFPAVAAGPPAAAEEEDSAGSAAAVEASEEAARDRAGDNANARIPQQIGARPDH